MASTILYLNHGTSLDFRGRRGKDLLRKVYNQVHASLAGAKTGINFTVATSTAADLRLVAGCSANISSGGSGSVGVVLNGTSITVSHGASDTVDAGAIAAAVNASSVSLIQHLIGATNLKSTLTLASVAAGTTITLAGFRFTAISGTTESYKDGDFTIGGTDTADGTSLCQAINRHSAASKYLFALNVAGACHVFPKSATWFTGPNAPPNIAVASAATVTVGSATFAASAYCGLWAKLPGRMGNCITIAASGTGQSIENSNTRFTRGAGPDAAPVSDNL